MNRRSLILIAVVLALAVPLSASQFVKISFDQVTRESGYIVRGTLGATWSAWDDEHQVIYTYAALRVSRYFGVTTGPDTLIVREVGGTVGDYTQEAIGFPVLREGEQVVLFLSKWEDSGDYRIHAYNQGKFLVKIREGVEMLVEDPVKQGEEPQSVRGPRVRATAMDATEEGLSLDEFAGMVDAAIAGDSVAAPVVRH